MAYGWQCGVGASLLFEDAADGQGWFGVDEEAPVGWWFDVSGAVGGWGGWVVRGGVGKVAGGGAGVAGVEDDFESDAVGELVDVGAEEVVGEHACGFEVVGTDGFVFAVGFVAVEVEGLGAVAGVVEDEEVSGGGVVGEPADAFEDAAFGGSVVGDDFEVCGF